MLRLILSQDDPENTTLSTEDGRMFYTVSTPRKWRNITTTVTKYALGHDGRPTEESLELARVQWHDWHPTRLVYNGQITNIKDFIPRGRDGLFSRWVDACKQPLHAVTNMQTEGATITSLRLMTAHTSGRRKVLDCR